MIYEKECEPMKQLDHEDVLKLLPDRSKTAHKGDFGKLLLICGSQNCTGAPALASVGALRCGAGLVYLAVPSCIHAIEAVKLTEPVIFSLPCSDGMLSREACMKLETLLSKVNTVLIGPGLGISVGTEAVVSFVLDNFKGTVVLDADGINVIKSHKDILRRRKYPTVITPHEGEFLRFGGNLQNGRVNGAQELAMDLNVIVVLKGHQTVITDGHNVYINPTGNPGMATGGSGDVLAGMITALIGQGIAPIEASAMGVWLHGAAGDLCAEVMGQYAMLPSDIFSVLPRLLK